MNEFIVSAASLRSQARIHRGVARRLAQAAALLEEPERKVGRPRHGKTELVRAIGRSEWTYAKLAAELAVNVKTVSEVVRGLKRRPELEQHIRALIQEGKP